MRKLRLVIAACCVISTACVVWIVRRTASEAFTSHASGAPPLLTQSKATSRAPRAPRIILFMTLPNFHGSPLWFGDASEMGNPFLRRRCPYSDCVVTSNISRADEAALLVFKGPMDDDKCCSRTATGASCVTYGSRLIDFPAHSPRNAFVFFQKEPSLKTHRECLVPLDDVVNYTWTYKSDSDVPAAYGSYYALPSQKTPRSVPDAHSRADRNVLWYVSNCNSMPEVQRRLKYVAELRKHIDVDVYGRCSNASDPCPNRNGKCVAEFRRRYKFYIAFENSDCDEYVTEKFYTALIGGNVPIVRGLPRSQYERLAPPHSFIHADDFESPKTLADYLRRLASSPEEYNGYHAWRANYGVSASVDGACKLCELATLRPHKRVRVSDWWSAERNCRVGAGGKAIATGKPSRQP